jgi:hypothetical protein
MPERRIERELASDRGIGPRTRSNHRDATRSPPLVRRAPGERPGRVPRPDSAEGAAGRDPDLRGHARKSRSEWRVGAHGLPFEPLNSSCRRSSPACCRSPGSSAGGPRAYRASARCLSGFPARTVDPGRAGAGRSPVGSHQYRGAFVRVLRFHMRLGRLTFASHGYEPLYVGCRRDGETPPVRRAVRTATSRSTSDAGGTPAV